MGGDANEIRTRFRSPDSGPIHGSVAVTRAALMKRAEGGADINRISRVRRSIRTVVMWVCVFAITLATPFAAPGSVAAATGSFATIASMLSGRAAHTMTVLPTGKVLVVGGYNARPSAELYDAANRTFAVTGATISPRVGHTATLLATGKVLVAGGAADIGAIGTAELYDPTTGTFAPTGSLINARFGHTATRLADGRVLVAGGTGGGAASTTAEIYDPLTGNFSLTSAMTTGRFAHTATALGNGKVLIAGGGSGVGLATGPASAELYDPLTGTFMPTGSMSVGRIYGTATALPSGNILVTGGFPCVPCGPHRSADVYDTATGTFTSGGLMTTGRGRHAAAPLPDGAVLVVGGFDDYPFLGRSLASAEVYDPRTNNFAVTASMTTPRGDLVTQPLPSGDVLVTGGYQMCCGPTAAAELFIPVVPDVTPPLVIASLSALPNADGWNSGSVTVTWSVSDPESGIASSTGCDSVTLAADTPGTTLICSATNGSGLTASVSVTVRIDSTAPTVTCTVEPSLIWPPNHKLVETVATVSIGDELSGPIGFVLGSLTSNETDDAADDGTTVNDIEEFTLGTADTSGLLRAERSGSGTGRTYTLTYTALDRAGNSASATCAVTVPLDR